MKRIYFAMLPVVAAFSLAACGSSGSSAQPNTPAPPANTTPAATTNGGATTPAPASTPGGTALPTSPGSVTIGSDTFPESELLMDIYGDAMAAKGVQVTKKPNVGERAVRVTALKDGSITAMPEYTGSILPYLDPKATAKTPQAVYKALLKVAANNGFAVGKFADAQDSDTITVTKQTAQKYHLKTIADLKPVAGNLTLGAPAQFKTRPDGVPGLKKVYGVVFGNYTVTDAGGTVTVDALKNGSIDAADIFSTDPSIAANGFVPLEDPKSMFAAQNIIPMFSKKVLTKPMLEACNAVSAKLDTPTLASLVAKVAGGQDAEQVAKGWLTQEHLG